MNFLYITLGIIIIFLLFILYRFLIASKTPVVKDIYLPNGNPDIPFSKLKISDYSTYSIEVWIYVNKLPTTDEHGKYIGTDCNSIMDGEGQYNQTGVIFYKSENFSLNLYSNGTLTFYNGRYFKATASSPIDDKDPIKKKTRNGGDDWQKHPSVMSMNFPVQKWTYVCISIQNNSLVDLYVNGKLMQSTSYKGEDSLSTLSKPLSTDILHFGKKVDATIKNMYITPKATDTRTAWNNYLKGPGIKKNFNLGVSLTQNGKATNTINIL